VSAPPLDYHGEVTGVVIEDNGIRLWMYPDGPSNGGGDQVSLSNRVAVSRGEESFEFEPTDAVERASHIASRLRQTIAVSIDEDRDLAVILNFGDGYRWVCRQGDGYEAWDLIASGWQWISVPGGAVRFLSEPSTNVEGPQV